MLPLCELIQWVHLQAAATVSTETSLDTLHSVYITLCYTAFQL